VSRLLSVAAFLVSSTGLATPPAWVPMTLTQPAGSSGALVSVSCVSKSACVAVGDGSVSVEVGVADVWNGRKWPKLLSRR
jgi:hypothetical protein